MPDLIAIAYPEETTAGQAGEELERRAAMPIDPDALGVIVCERDGSLQLISSLHPGATVGWGRFWGTLLEAVMAESEIEAFDPAFRAQIRRMLSPGTSMLLIAVSNVTPEQAVEAVSQYGGLAVTCPLTADRMSDLPVALDARA